VLVTVLLVFALGFLSGAFLGPTDNRLLSGLSVGLAATGFFLVLSIFPAFLWTLIQSTRHDLARRSLEKDTEPEPEPFRRRFMENLEATMDFVVQGLTP
jgi:hypothetical protein